MTFDHILVTVFALSVAAIVYHHLGYPILLRRIASVKGRTVGISARECEVTSDLLPMIEVIVPAHNEAAVIAAKIANLASLDYPQERLSVVIALDGCTDATHQIANAAAAQFADRLSVQFVVYPENIGKIAVLNDRIEAARADIVALSDASALIDADALRKAAVHFADREVGVVCGTYRLATAGSEGEQAYWKYQVRIKADEAAIAAPMGAHGAFYLFRRALWAPLPPDTINDDFVLPMRIVARGYRAIYDQAIVATEMECTTPTQEFRRRIRIGAGNMQQLVRLASLANPRRAALAFVFLSGKGLRALVPFLALAAVLATAVLAIEGEQLFQLMLAAQIVVFALALGVILTRSQGHPKPLKWLGYMVEGYFASAIGALSVLTARPRNPWLPSAAQGARELPSFVPRSVAIAKRSVDIAAGLVGLAILAVLFLPIAAAIKLTSPGPVLYRQLRVGRSTPLATHLFYLIKFRSMYQDAEVANGPQWSVRGDSRVTPVGRFLRKTRLDELPQFINIVHGDMSLVGPRPERPEFFKKLEQEIPFYSERTFDLKPGLTGLAQVNQDPDTSIDDVRRKVLFDHRYAVALTSWWRWLSMDLSIILETIKVVFTARGH